MRNVGVTEGVIEEEEEEEDPGGRGERGESGSRGSLLAAPTPFYNEALFARRKDTSADTTYTPRLFGAIDTTEFLSPSLSLSIYLSLFSFFFHTPLHCSLSLVPYRLLVFSLSLSLLFPSPSFIFPSLFATVSRRYTSMPLDKRDS